MEVVLVTLHGALPAAENYYQDVKKTCRHSEAFDKMAERMQKEYKAWMYVDINGDWCMSIDDDKYTEFMLRWT